MTVESVSSDVATVIQSTPTWCKMVKTKWTKKLMANRRVSSFTAPAERTVRASVSFPEDQYVQLELIAQQQHVSIAWVVREAVQSYLLQRWPLLESGNFKEQTENQYK